MSHASTGLGPQGVWGIIRVTHDPELGSMDGELMELHPCRQLERLARGRPGVCLGLVESESVRLPLVLDDAENPLRVGLPTSHAHTPSK